MPTTDIKSNRAKLPDPAGLTELLGAPLAPLDFVLPGFKRGTVGGLISPGGVGKSYWALSVAVALAAGPECDLTGLAPAAGKVLLLSAEDPEDILAQRLQAMQSCLPAPLALSHLDYRSCLGLTVNIMDSHWYAQVALAAQGCRLVILDTLTRFHSLDENSAADMQALLAQLERLAKDSGAAVLYLHHTSKASALGGQGNLQQAARGSSVLADNARWVAFLSVMTEQEARLAGVPAADRLNHVRWNISKQNYGAPRPDQWYRRGAGGVLLPDGRASAAGARPDRLAQGAKPQSAAAAPPKPAATENVATPYGGNW